MNAGPMSYSHVPDMNRIEFIIMGDIWAFLKATDRGPGAIAPLDCDPISGLPKNEAPRPIMDPFTGLQIGMSLGSLIRPASMATGGLDLACSLTLWAGSVDSEGGYTPGLAACHSSLITNGKKTRLSEIPKSQWPEHAVAHWREFAFRIRKVFMLWARRGLCDPQPTLYEKPEPLGLDLLPRVIRPYHNLVELARRIIPGTPWANRPHSILHDLTPSERLTQPKYAQDSYAAEVSGSGASGNGAVDVKAEPAAAADASPIAADPPAPTTQGGE